MVISVIGACARGALELDNQLQKTMRTPLFSRELRILLYVWKNQGCSIKDAQAESGLSQRGFYLKVREMMDNDIIVLSDGEHDRRMRSLSVGEGGMALLSRIRNFSHDDAE